MTDDTPGVLLICPSSLQRVLDKEMTNMHRTPIFHIHISLFMGPVKFGIETFLPSVS
jgi:hypothetical protein